MEVQNKPQDAVMIIPYCHQDGGDKSMLRMPLYRICFGDAGAIYEFAAPYYVATDELSFQMSRRNLINIFNSDGR